MHRSFRYSACAACRRSSSAAAAATLVGPALPDFDGTHTPCQATNSNIVSTPWKTLKCKLLEPLDKQAFLPWD